jgi:hypothetical protein
MINIVILVINRPKLPLLAAEYILIVNAVKNNGYIINNGTLGTVSVNVMAMTKFSAQLTVSNTNRTGWLRQSLRIKLTVLCQSIKVYDQQFLRCL